MDSNFQLLKLTPGVHDNSAKSTKLAAVKFNPVLATVIDKTAAITSSSL